MVYLWEIHVLFTLLNLSDWYRSYNNDKSYTVHYLSTSVIGVIGVVTTVAAVHIPPANLRIVTDCTPPTTLVQIAVIAYLLFWIEGAVITGVIISVDQLIIIGVVDVVGVGITVAVVRFQIPQAIFRTVTVWTHWLAILVEIAVIALLFCKS